MCLTSSRNNPQSFIIVYRPLYGHSSKYMVANLDLMSFDMAMSFSKRYEHWVWHCATDMAASVTWSILMLHFVEN